MALLETTKEKFAGVIISILIIVVIIGSCIDITAYQMIKDSESGKKTDLTPEDIMNKFQTGYIFSIIMLVFALLVVVSGGGYLFMLMRSKNTALAE